jgi:hypothetical protein
MRWPSSTSLPDHVPDTPARNQQTCTLRTRTHTHARFIAARMLIVAFNYVRSLGFGLISSSRAFLVNGLASMRCDAQLGSPLDTPIHHALYVLAHNSPKFGLMYFSLIDPHKPLVCPLYAI